MEECKQCGRLFKRAADLKKHQNMQRVRCRSTYDCPCGLKFITKPELFWHCRTCGYDYDDIRMQWYK